MSLALFWPHARGENCEEAIAQMMNSVSLMIKRSHFLCVMIVQCFCRLAIAVTIGLF